MNRLASQTSNLALQTPSRGLIPRLRICYAKGASTEIGEFGIAARRDDKLDQETMADSLLNLARKGEYNKAYSTLMDSHWNLEDYELPLARVAFSIFVAAADVRSAQSIHNSLYKEAYKDLKGEDIAGLASLCARSGDFQYGIEILHSRLNWMLQERNISPAGLGEELFCRLERIDNSKEGLPELLDALGDLLCLTGDSSNAVRSYQALISHRGSDPKLSTLILGLMLTEPSTTQVSLLEACAAAEIQHPRNREIRMFKARSLWKVCGHEATEEWIASQQSNPDLKSDFLWPWTAHAMLQRGQPAQAKRFIEDYLARDKKEGTRIEIHCLLELARCYDLLGEQARVHEIVEFIVQDPRSLTFDIRELVFEFAFHELKDSALALKLLKKMTNNEIYEVKRLKHEANVHAHEGDHIKCLQAINGFSECVKLTAAEHTMKGDALFGLKRFEEATSEYRLAQSKGSDYESFSNEIPALLHAGKWDEALYSFCRLETKYEHENVTALVPMAYFLSGQWDKIGDAPTPPQYIDLGRATSLYADASRIHGSWKCKPESTQDKLTEECQKLGIQNHACTVEQLFYRL